MIAPERQAVILGSLHANNPEERAFLAEHITRCGLDKLFPPVTRKADSFPADYEGAILARQEEP